MFVYDEAALEEARAFARIESIACGEDPDASPALLKKREVRAEFAEMRRQEKAAAVRRQTIHVDGAATRSFHGADVRVEQDGSLKIIDEREKLIAHFAVGHWSCYFIERRLATDA